MSSQHLALAERHLVEARIRIDRQEKIVSAASADRDVAEDLLSILRAIEQQMVRHRDLIAHADRPGHSSRSVGPLNGILEATHYRELGRRLRGQAFALGFHAIKVKLLRIADKYETLAAAIGTALDETRLTKERLPRSGVESRNERTPRG